ncbi:hypothetical protein BDZ89DRAFT_1133960 [Hymenopellis radicata]|nr:hypothetical protein BDZ89DRAFT_1133960 [Hymenopellis radicata]
MTFPISPPSATAGDRLSERILENASAYTCIQASLAELRHVPTVLKTQSQKLKTLEKELSRTIVDVRQLDEATRKQRDEHEQMRDATARKLAYKLAGKKEKFEEIASKEERDYVDALNRQVVARRRQEELEMDITKAKAEHNELTGKMNSYDILKDDLWNLCESVFEGQNDPRDTELKEQLFHAEVTQELFTRQDANDRHVVTILQQAEDKMKVCHTKIMKEVFEQTRGDVYGSSAKSDKAKRNNLREARALGDEAIALIRTAQNATAEVQDIGEFVVPQVSVRLEAFFLQTVFEIPFRSAMGESGEQVIVAHKRLKEELTGALRRAERSRADLVVAIEVVNECRANVTAYRRGRFDLVLSHGLEKTSESEALPVYVS